MSTLGLILICCGLIVLIVIGVYAFGFRSAKNSDVKKEIQNDSIGNKARVSVSKLSADDVDRELQQWERR